MQRHYNYHWLQLSLLEPQLLIWSVFPFLLFHFILLIFFFPFAQQPLTLGFTGQHLVANNIAAFDSFFAAVTVTASVAFTLHGTSDGKPDHSSFFAFPVLI